MIVRGRKLIDQAHQRLSRERVDHGVLMAGNNHFHPNAQIQLCSIDTLRSRGLRPHADLIVIDEAHYAVSPTFRAFLAQYPEAYILAVTATPFVSKSLRHVADTIVAPISISELIKQGFLVDGRYYAPKTPDLSKVSVSKSTGDYVVDELSHVMSDSSLVGDLVTEWKKLAEFRSTFCFCVDIEHSRTVCTAFNASGVRAEHCDANTPDHERNLIIRRLEHGQTKILCSVGTMTTGVDVPSLGCLILARPTKSYILHVQMIGRATRPAPGKEDFLVLDHASNLMKHGTLRDVDRAEPSIDGKAPQLKMMVRTCSHCYGVFQTAHGPCPLCGYQEIRVTPARGIEQKDGELEEFNSDPVVRRFNQLKTTQKLRGYRRGWTYHQMVAEFGPEVAEKFVPKRIVPEWILKRKT